MLELEGKRIYYVDFHCQWPYTEGEGIFLAGLSYCGFDAGLMVVPRTYDAICRAVEESGSDFVPFRGMERGFMWGHVLTMGYDGEVPADADFRKTLRYLKERSSLVIFAHPMHGGTREALWDSGLTPGLLEDGLVDAIELVNSYNLDRDPELMAWYVQELREGKSIPITGGCDVHYLQAEQRPGAIYTPAFPPHVNDILKNDVDALGSLRTLVFADECTEKAIVDAVRNCRTVIETQGKLFGPESLVKWLVDAGYWEASAKALHERRLLSLTGPDKFFSGQDVDTVRTATALSEGCVTVGGRDTTFCGDRPAFCVPPIDADGDAWVPISVSDSEGRSLTSALRVVQPVALDLFGCRAPGDPDVQVQVAVTNQRDDVVSGGIDVVLDGTDIKGAASFEGLQPDARYDGLIPLKGVTHYDVPSGTKATVRLVDGTECAMERDLTFVAGRRTEDGEHPDWSRAEEIRLEDKGRVAMGNWEGPEDVSAVLKLLWSDRGIHVHADVRDDIHFQPYHGVDVYQGDCIQVGLDVTLERGQTQATMYEFMAAMTETGPELFCSLVPTAPCDGTIPKSHTLLPASCVSIGQTPKGLVYDLCIPWSWLVPLAPAKGSLFGFYVVLWDNDGPEHEVTMGSKSVMTWPDTIIYGWKAGTVHWAAITLIE